MNPVVREDGRGWVEAPIKVVGRRRPMTPEEALHWNEKALSLAPAWTRWRPRGVFRFKTYSEVEEWDQRIRMEAMRRVK